MRACPSRDQDRVFHPGPQRRIVLATNVAETSLTVPRIRYVIDPGVARVKRYSPRQKLDRLHIEPVSQASADQRKGRCGRIAAGICYRLYSEADFQSRPRYTDPEILRASLAGVILRMLRLSLGRVEDFPFIDPPDPRAIADGWQQLAELGAVDKERRLTADRPADGAAAGGREAGAHADRRAAPWLPARGDRARGVPRHPGSARAAEPMRAKRPTPRTRSSPIRTRNSSACSSCGTTIAPRTRS